MRDNVIEPEVLDAENKTVAPEALSIMERAAIDTQISTARAYPRQLSVVKRDMLSMATESPETAARCFYTLTRRNADGTTKLIEGPSIRLAEIALACWGNISAASRVVADDGKFVTSQGVAWDMEKNIRISKETKRRVTNREGRRFSDDMVAVTGNAACSISLRNAIVSVIPGIIIKDVYEAAKKVAAGSAATLGSRRVAAMAKFKEMGVDESRVFSALGVKGLEDINLEKITILIGLYNAIQDKETTIEEAFPTLTVKSPTVAGVTGKPAVTSTFTAGSGNPPTVQETKKASEDLIWLQQQMVENNIDEKIVIEHMRAAQFSDESLDSLAMIDEMQPEALQRTRKFWKSFVKKLKPSEPAK